MKKCLDTRKLHVFTVSFNNGIARPALGFKSEPDLVSQVELQVCCGHNHLPNISNVKTFLNNPWEAVDFLFLQLRTSKTCKLPWN